MVKEEYKKNNLWKSRENLRKLAVTNFKEGDKFVTLTFSDENDFDITNIAECNKKYTLFIRRLAREVDGFKYITVLEFQKRGAVHYHILCNLPYIKKSKLAKIWSHGFVRINRIESSKHIVRYISKYLAKYADDERFIGHRRYSTSAKLSRPVKLEKFEGRSILRRIRENNLSPLSWNRYFSQYHGMVGVEVYNLEDLPNWELL